MTRSALGSLALFTSLLSAACSSSTTQLPRRSQSAAETRVIGCKICPSTGKVAKVAGSGERLEARRERRRWTDCGFPQVR